MVVTKKPGARSQEQVLKTLFIILVLAFLFLPILILVAFSFNESQMNIIFTGFTLDWYKNLFENRALLEAFRNTLLIAVLSTLISTVIGTISAVGFKKYNFFGEKFVGKLIYIPIVIPEIVMGISLLAIFTFFKIELGFFTVLLAHIAFSIPFVITSVRSTLYSFSENIEEAAEDLGATNFETFRYVTLPMIKPGIISGAILAFTLSLDDVVISYFAAGPGTNTLPLYIYSNIKTGITPDVNALTTLMLVVTILALFISSKIEAQTLSRRQGK
ncbi:ABC transporter permease subunit [Candidatus Saccharibacteria bacterium]|nr:ABC transporter permease subunit [Candidatus Saccharibacteria bacterium]